LPTGGDYPEIGANDSIWIKVSKEKQKVYIMNGNNVVYTMVCSTGLDTSPDTSTPEGTFYIQQERGLNFYNGSEQEGAKYWVSWKNHGEFLFHSVATDKQGNVIQSEALKLGQKASHGCVRLAVPDAKWIYDNIKYNTKVVIA
jgi:lipoprotein-anchoring transpeptidase ErfK/SrfK